MGEKQSCSIRRLSPEKPGRTDSRRHAQSGWPYGLCLLVAALSVAGLLGPGSAGERAHAQEAPASGKAAAGTETRQEPARADAGQEPITAEALSLRYRFIERYGLTEDPSHPELIMQYRVGVRETQKMEREKAQGAPDKTEISRQAIYTERAAQVGKLGEMVSAVRRYDRFSLKDAVPARPVKPPLFEGLLVWLRRQTGQKPKIVSLNPLRPLREFEFSEITKQVIVPQLTALFPPTPKRVGDTWQIPRTSAYCLVGETPDAEDYELTGTLVEVRKAPTGAGLTAVIGVSGTMNLSIGLSSLNAQIHFGFETSPAAGPSKAGTASAKGADQASGKSRDQRDAGIVDARGRITRVLMLWAASEAIPDGDGRLKQTATYQLNLERRFGPGPNEAAGAPTSGLLTLPDPPPTADESNSWVVHDDPDGRFHFFHPQGLVLNLRMMDADSVHLVDEDPGVGQDVFVLQLAPGKTDPDADRKFRDAQQFQRDIDAAWSKRKAETLRGSSGWLPEAGWAPWKVYRKELGVKTPAANDGTTGVQRIYIDDYLVLSSRNECFHVESMTVRNDHVAFRTQAEAIIKSFRFGPWDGKPKSISPAPAAPETAPR